MKTESFIKRSRIEAPAEEVFRWHLTPGALEALIPPDEPMRVVEKSGQIGRGARVVFAVRVGPIPLRWVAEHTDYVEGREFTDVQISGPFARWTHRHRVEPDGPAACYLQDHIDYALPFGWLGRTIAGSFVRRRLERLFDYRHRVTAAALRDRALSAH